MSQLLLAQFTRSYTDVFDRVSPRCRIASHRIGLETCRAGTGLRPAILGVTLVGFQATGGIVWWLRTRGHAERCFQRTEEARRRGSSGGVRSCWLRGGLGFGCQKLAMVLSSIASSLRPTRGMNWSCLLSRHQCSFVFPQVRFAVVASLFELFDPRHAGHDSVSSHGSAGRRLPSGCAAIPGRHSQGHKILLLISSPYMLSTQT